MTQQISHLCIFVLKVYIIFGQKYYFIQIVFRDTLQMFEVQISLIKEI